MKDPQSLLYVYTTDDPTDPEANPTGIRPLVASESGILLTQVVGSGGTPVIEGGPMGGVIVTSGVGQADGLNSRSLLYALDASTNGADAVSHSVSGDISIPGGDNALNNNAMLYAYDLDTDDGSSLSLLTVISADTVPNDANGLIAVSALYADNGSTSLSRIDAGSATNLANVNANRAVIATPPGEWTLTHAPAADTQATATRAAGGAGVRHVLKSIQASINAVAAITAPLTVVVRDGASGAGTILWQDRLTAPAGTDSRVSKEGLNIVGSANTAMTVEFTAAPGATNFETVSATGTSAGA
jgi:hypothetical protein